MRPGQAFYTKKRLIFISVAAVAAIVLMQVVGIAVQAYESKRAKSELARLAAIEARRSPADKSAEQAQKYLENRIASVDPATRLILDYVQRKFKLSSSLGAAETPINVSSGEGEYPTELDYVARISFPDKTVSTAPGQIDSPVSYVNIHSANCDLYGLPGDFWGVMEANISRGGYFATHNALGFLMIEDNQCQLPDNYDSIKERTFAVMSKITTDAEVVPDLRYEAIALLLASDQRRLVTDSSMQTMISEQRSDGSWRGIPTDKYMDEHATLVAMWALLEYDNPDTPSQALIRSSAAE